MQLLDECQAMLEEGPGLVLRHAMERSGYLAELVAEDTVESAGREENVQELIGVASEFMQVDEFLEQSHSLQTPIKLIQRITSR